MGTKARLRLTLRSICFALLLTAAAFRLISELTSGGSPNLERAAMFVGLGITDTPTVPADTAPSPAQNEPKIAWMAYAMPVRKEYLHLSAENVSIRNGPEASLNIEQMLQEPIRFDLNADGPLVLIVHTHATEAYTPADGDDYLAQGAYRTTDTAYNVVRVGQALTDRLNELGISTLHDTTLYDTDGYYDAYDRAADGIGVYLARYPSIQMVIDVHRDAIEDEAGNQLALRTTVNGESAARLLLVMGSDIAGLYHPTWRENLAFAVKLQALCEQDEPGIFRELSLRSQRYNQYLTPHSVLLEVGAAGNTLREAIRSAEYFGDELVKLLHSADVTD